MNWDMSRETEFSKLFKYFVEKNNLKSAWKQFPTEFSHVHTDGFSTSLIDHFLISPELFQVIENCQALHSGDNLSRHSPIILKLKLSDVKLKTESFHQKPRPVPAWNKAKESEIREYELNLRNKLSNLDCPVSLHTCSNSECSEVMHNKDCDSFILDNLFAMIESSYCSIPLTGQRCAKSRRKSRKSNRIVPGWSEYVEPFRQQSKDAFQRWYEAGKPRSGTLFEEKQHYHAQYRHAVRRVKRASKFHRANGLFNAAQHGNCELMNEMKKVMTGESLPVDLPEVVDGATGDEIAAKFKEVYEKLYNSSDSSKEMEEIEEIGETKLLYMKLCRTALVRQSCYM